MKILYAAPLPLGELRQIGCGKRELKGNHEHFLFSLFSYVRKKGNEIILVTSSRDIRKEEVYHQEILTIRIVPLWKHGRLSALDTFRTDVKRIAEMIRKEDADLYHAQWSYEEAMACLITHPEKTLITMHDWPDAVCPAIGNYYWRKRNILGNEVIKRGKYFIAVSPYIRKKLLSMNKNAEVEVIPNYFCEDELEMFKDTSEEHEDIRVLCVNNGFSGIKNTEVAMKAFAEARKELPDIRLDMYGDDYEKGGAAEKWANNNLDSTDGITFHGKASRSEMAKAFSEANILLHTSKEESFGLVYLEAMASGTAIVAGQTTGATPWVLGEGLSSHLTDISDKESVKNKLKEVIKEGHKEYAYNRLKEIYLDDIVLRRTYNLYLGL